jgi:hypothetical protein
LKNKILEKIKNELYGILSINAFQGSAATNENFGQNKTSWKSSLVFP